MKVFLAHASDFDFKEKLYIPLRASALNTEYEFIFPQEDGKEEITKETIKGAMAFIADVSRPSTGAGIEMGWANAFSVPILCIYETGSVVSSSIDYVTKTRIEYNSSEDLIAKLSEALKALR